MGYTTTIKCEQCGTEANVPGVGAVPTGWIISKMQHTAEDTKPATFVWCGWRCASTFSAVQAAQQSVVTQPNNNQQRVAVLP